MVAETNEDESLHDANSEDTVSIPNCHDGCHALS